MCTAKSPKAPAPVAAAPSLPPPTAKTLRPARILSSRNNKAQGSDVLSQLRIPLMIPGIPSSDSPGVS